MEDPDASLLCDLDLVPAHAHLAGGVRLGVGEDVRVTTDQLAGDAVRDVRPVSLAALGAEQREERRLEEKVSELVDQLRRRARLAGGLGDLVRLLEGVRHDRLDRLHPIPRALAAKRLRQLEQLDRRLCGGPPLQRRTCRNRLGALAARERERPSVERSDRVGALVELDAVRDEGRPERCRALVESNRAGLPQRLERRDGEKIGIAGTEGNDAHGPYRLRRASRWWSSPCRSSRPARSPWRS